MTIRGRYTSGDPAGALLLTVLAPGGGVTSLTNSPDDPCGRPCPACSPICLQSVASDGLGVEYKLQSTLPGSWGVSVEPRVPGQTWEVTVELAPPADGFPGRSYRFASQQEATYSFAIPENCT